MFKTLLKFLGIGEGDAAQPLQAPVVYSFQEPPPVVVGVSGSSSDSASVMAMMAMVRGQGGIPMFLGNHAQRKAAEDIQKIDMLIVMGNSQDMPVVEYSKEPVHSKTKEITNPASYTSDADFKQGVARLEYEREMLRLAEAQGMPTLGVCAGMQLEVVRTGGSLHQHIPDLLGGNALHAQGGLGIPNFCAVQPIHLEQGTRLGEIAQGISSVYAPAHGVSAEGNVMENSLHHQAVKEIGQGMKLAARSADDGIIEAVESADGRFLGVQWHPEFGASALGPLLVAERIQCGQEFAQVHQRMHPVLQAAEESMKSGLPSIRAKAPELAAQMQMAV